MNLLEMVKHLRTSILDDTGGTGVVWEDITEDQDEVELLRWSNEELTIFINEAIKKACRSSYLLKDSQPTFNITLADLTSDYLIDQRIIRVKSARLVTTGKRLTQIAYEDIWDETTVALREGKPSYYYVDSITGIASVYPIPTTESGLEDIQFIAYREELSPLSWEDDNEASPEINPRYHLPVLNYAAYLAYLKDEANSLDPARAQQFLGLFIQDFDDTSVHAEVRRTRNKKGTVAYGGIR